MLKVLVIGLIVFMAFVWGLGYLSESALHKVSMAEYNRNFIAGVQRYVAEQTAHAKEFLDRHLTFARG